MSCHIPIELLPTTTTMPEGTKTERKRKLGPKGMQSYFIFNQNRTQDASSTVSIMLILHEKHLSLSLISN